MTKETTMPRRIDTVTADRLAELAEFAASNQPPFLDYPTVTVDRWTITATSADHVHVTADAVTLSRVDYRISAHLSRGDDRNRDSGRRYAYVTLDPGGWQIDPSTSATRCAWVNYDKSKPTPAARDALVKALEPVARFLVDSPRGAELLAEAAEVDRTNNLHRAHASVATLLDHATQIQRAIRAWQTGNTPSADDATRAMFYRVTPNA